MERRGVLYFLVCTGQGEFGWDRGIDRGGNITLYLIGRELNPTALKRIQKESREISCF